MGTEYNKIRTFQDLYAWQRAHQLALSIYKLTSEFPPGEIYGLVSQMRRASVSVISNIAEGFSRAHAKEKNQFYAISLGSLSELQSQLIISRDLGFINAEKFNQGYETTIVAHKLCNGLIKATKSQNLSHYS